MRIELDINGATREVEVEPRTTLLDCLRDTLGLTGAQAAQAARRIEAETGLPAADPIRDGVAKLVKAVKPILNFCFSRRFSPRPRPSGAWNN